MYSVVLLMAMTTGGESADGCRGCRGCSSCNSCSCGGCHRARGCKKHCGCHASYSCHCAPSCYASYAPSCYASAPVSYAPAASGGSNLGPTSRKLKERIAADVERLKAENPQPPGPVPLELVTTSGSGLDPHVSLEAARWHAPRVAAARGVNLTAVRSVVEGDIDLLGILGLSDSARNGYRQIKVTFHVEGDADDATLREIVEQSRRRSAVYDALTNPIPVQVEVVTF